MNLEKSENMNSKEILSNYLDYRIANSLKKAIWRKVVEHSVVDPKLPELEKVTFRNYVVLSRKKFGTEVGLTELLCSLEAAVKQSSEFLRRPGLVIGYGEEVFQQKQLNLVVQKIENIFLNMLMTVNIAYYIISAARQEIVTIKPWRQGCFIVAINPLDDKENVLTSQPKATTFAIYRPNKEERKKCSYRDLMYSPAKDSMVVAGYAVYSFSTHLIIAFLKQKEILEFVYDMTIGEFILVNEKIKIPEEKQDDIAYCFDSANKQLWLNQYLRDFINPKNVDIIHLGSFTTNFHHILNRGGLLIDPPSTTFPSGQFQIITTLWPLAAICCLAGGSHVGGEDLTLDLLSVGPKSLNENSACLMGSKRLITSWLDYLKTNALFKK